MKKFLALILSLSMICSMTPVAFAASPPTGKTRTGIVGVIVHEEATQLSQEHQLLRTSSEGQATGLSTMSYTENADGSYTTYQYLDGVLTDKHTTIPGSGIVNHTYYNLDGTYTEVTENVSAQQGIVSAAMFSGAPDHVSTRNMGYMHYDHIWTGTRYSISVEIYDRYYYDSEFTFGVGDAKTLADWTSALLAVWAFSVNPVTLASAIVGFLSATGLLNLGVDAIYTALFTQTIRCTYANQTFYGTATAPNTNYPVGELEGTYAVVKNGSQTETITEGYTAGDWGNRTFGRMMMYRVFGIDDAPTSWTNLGN